MALVVEERGREVVEVVVVEVGTGRRVDVSVPFSSRPVSATVVEEVGGDEVEEEGGDGDGVVVMLAAIEQLIKEH